MQVAKMTGPPKPWCSDHGVEVTSCRAHLHEEKGENKDSIPHMSQDLWSHVENERGNIPLAEQTGMTGHVCSIEDQASIPVLLLQANLVQFLQG